VILLKAGLANSQERELQFKNYTITEGLSHNTVHCFAQDEKGFLWIGTEFGLNRFDGYTFTTYTKNAEDSSSIADSFINSLYIDKRQNLWIGTNSKGICLYLKYAEKFKSFSTYQYQGKAQNIRMVNSIVEDTRGHLWIGSFSGLFEFDPLNGKIVSQFHASEEANGLSDNEIRYLYLEKDDVLWIGTNNGGLQRFDIKTRTFKTFMHNPLNKSSLSNNSVSAVFRDKSGTLWIGTNWGLNILDESNGVFKHHYNDLSDPSSINANTIYSIYEDHLHKLWIGTIHGLNQYDKQNDRFFSWTFVPSTNQSFFENQVFTFFEDKTKQFWIGTATQGVGKFNNNLKKFNSISLGKPKTSKQSNDNIIREIIQQNDSMIWIGTLNRGLYILNRNNGQITNYRNIPGNLQSLSDNRVISILCDSKGNNWIGTWEGGLNKAIMRNGKLQFKQILKNQGKHSSISNTIIKEIIEDKWGQIWLGTEGGLNIYYLGKNEVIHIAHQPENTNSLINNSIQSGCMLFDKNNNLWVGTWGGLSMISFTDETRLPEKFTNYVQNDKTPNSISENRIIALHLDRKNNLWAGTFGGGLNKITLGINSKVKSIRYYTEKDGLANNVVYAILEDENGCLWLSTNNGLSKFYPDEERFENYDVTDGLLSNQFFWGAAYRLKSGELAFGGIKGINTFYPHEIVPDKDAPTVVITDFKLFDSRPEINENSMLRKSIIFTDTIFLDYKDKILSFEFAALHFADPSKNNYMYKLEGFNMDWVSVDAKRRFAVFTNLEPDEYVFMVKASNADGIWNNKPTRILLIIKPPFWQTWWFRILAGLVFILILIAILNLRLANLRRQKFFLKKIIQEKTYEIRNQNEELKSVNEELIATNDELEYKHKELEGKILEINEMQNQLIQAEKMASLGTLTAGVAHEINNPLNYIMGAQNTLENYFNEHGSADKNTTDFIQNTILVGVDRISGIVKGLNQFSRSNEKLDEDCYLHQIIDNCLVMLHNKLKHKAQVQKNYFDGQILIKGNVGKLHQVFVNILDNAIQAIETEGIIKIQTALTANKVHITIEDNGVGIAKHNLSKITDPFFTTKDPGIGTGLGLSISYSIIKDHKGSLEFESELNKGTKVVVTMPVKQE
jgi:signal transduction histidine kinase/ligand-binding sensor domain-containing protein